MPKRPDRPRNPKLAALIDTPPGNLWLPSLARKELEGYAYRYTIVLPLLSGSGEEVFSIRHDISDLTRLLNVRFKGCTSSGDRPPFIGYWLPESADDNGVDRSTNITVYTRVSNQVEEFFGRLKSALREIGRQEEILVERTDVWLTPSIDKPARR